MCFDGLCFSLRLDGLGFRLGGLGFRLDGLGFVLYGVGVRLFFTSLYSTLLWGLGFRV